MKCTAQTMLEESSRIRVFFFFWNDYQTLKRFIDKTLVIFQFVQRIDTISYTQYMQETTKIDS